MTKQKNRPTGDFTTNGQIFKLSAVAILIGALCAVIAVVLLKAIGFITNLTFYQRLSLSFTTPTGNHLGGWVVFMPAIGGLLIGLIAKYGSEKIRGHGIPEAIEAMLIHDSKVQPRVAFWKPISAAISIGTGGPYGAEGPIIMTGGSFGSLIAQLMHFSAMERRILLVAGAAGGMSATFAAPIASVLFAVELLVFEFRPRSVVPIALASAVADIIRSAWIGTGPIFGMPVLAHVSMHLIGVSVLIGVVGSLLAVLLTWGIYGVEDLFGKLPIHWMWWPAIGGIVVGLGGWLDPRVLGVGYDSIRSMLNNQLTLTMLLSLLVVKTIVWVISLGSGTSGGILAPILIIGGSLGGLAGQLTHAPHPGVWAMLGMSAIFAGVTRTPFTSIVFPLELTHNLGALLPLLLVSSIATGISAYFLPRSILTEKIARRGLHLTREYATDPLQMHLARELAALPSVCAQHNQSVMEVCQQVMASVAHLDAWVGVYDEAGSLSGAIEVITLMRLSGNPNYANSPVSQFVSSDDVPVIQDTQSVKVALETMLDAHAKWVVVEQDGRRCGLITTDQILELRRRERLYETKRQRVLVPRRNLLPVSAEVAPAKQQPM